MRDVAIVGASAAPVQKQAGNIRDLALQSGSEALLDAGVDRVDAVVVGSMASGEFTGQHHLGPMLADQLHLSPAPAFRVESACASGSAAFHMAWLAVKSGVYDSVLVTGVEKMSGVSTQAASRILAGAADYEYEVEQGATFVGLNALLMRRYLRDHGVRHEQLMPFAVNAHANAMSSPHALLKKRISLDEAMASPVVADPIKLYDCSPICDGSASVVLAARDAASPAREPVWVRGSGVASDTMSFHDRSDLLSLPASSIATARALQQARMDAHDLDVYEIHDAFTVMTPLVLESIGLFPRGQGWRAAAEGSIALDADVPISTYGGLKARGHPVGATGMYQLVEAVHQLRGRAGPNQVPDARTALVQNMGGTGSTIVVNILEASA
ncbi:MAG: thiolase domain-containing protein [Halobacteriales archaeon]|nr:thiolase domain-containing protein [Halobacteriales archaeon]